MRSAPYAAPVMTYDEHIRAVEREAATITAALRAGPLDATVPTCPGWTLVDLGAHVGQFCAWWSDVICEGTGRPKTPFTAPSSEETRSEWFAEWYELQAARLVEQLTSTDPATAVWTWDPSDTTTSFVARRSAHELAIHRFDVQAARSDTEPIDGALAVDGIEEIFAMIAAWRSGGRDVGAGSGETLHLHATDPEAEWTIELSPEGPVVERVHTKADFAMKGTASDLELVLYQRPPLGPVDLFGDDSVLDAWTRAFEF